MDVKEKIPEKTNKEQIREKKRAIDRSKRNLEKLKRKLDLQKKKMLLEIKKMVKKEQNKGAKMLSKDIIRINKQSKKLEQFIGQLTAISIRISYNYTINKLEEEMNNISKTINLYNNKLESQQINILGKEFVKENIKLDLNLEMMQKALEGFSESMENKEEEEKLYNEILKEVEVKNNEEMIGINEKLDEEKMMNLKEEKQLMDGIDNIGESLNNFDDIIKPLEE